MEQTFSFHLRRLREAAKASAYDLSLGTGIAAEEIQRLEAGTICASKEHVFRLANYFDGDESFFLRLNQVDRITRETKNCHGVSAMVGKCRSEFFKNSRLATRRTENMQHELDLIESRSFKVKLHTPRPELQTFIESIVYCKGHNFGQPFETVLPDGTTQLQIMIGEGGREQLNSSGQQIQYVNRAWLMGVTNTPITYGLSNVEGVIYIRFRPGGLYSFTGIHQDELKDRVMDARSIFGPTLDILWETLAHCGKVAEMILHVENFFLARLNEKIEMPAWIAYMLGHVDLPLSKLAQKTGYSAKYLTKTFQKVVGTGPKNFQRIQRFRASLCYFNQLADKVDWGHVVFQNGYYDQAHFIKNFKRFSGMSPQHYLSLGPSCAYYLHTSAPPHMC